MYCYADRINFLNEISEIEASRFQVRFSLQDSVEEQWKLKYACVIAHLVPMGNCVLGNICIFEGSVDHIRGDRFIFNAKQLLSEESVFISEAKVVKREELEELMLEISKHYQNSHQVVVLGAKQAIANAKQVHLEDS